MNDGDKLPDFSALKEDGTVITQNDFKSGRYIFYFYPKDNTPGCTKESCDFRDAFSDFRDQGFEIFGISKDPQKKHIAFKERFSLPFTLISDEDGSMCTSFDVWREKSFMGKKYMGIDRSSFVIVDGIIQKVWHGVRVLGHVKDVLKTVLK